MYQTSAVFGNLIQQDSRTFRAKITLGDDSITEGIMSIRVNGGSNSEDDFSIGSAVSQYVEITFAASDIVFEGREFFLEMGVVADGTVEEYIPMGYFTAGKPDTDEEESTVTAYDRMIKTERACFLELPESTTTTAILNAISIITGVPVVTTGLAAIPIKKPVGYTCREVLSYIAQMYGGFAVCSRSGQIEIRTYEDQGYTVGTGRYWDTFVHNDYAFTLQKITCYTGRDEEGEDISITVGSGVRGISFSNPFMTQGILDNIWVGLEGFTYMPGSLKFLGDPRVDPWDILTVEDRNGKIYKVPAMKLAHDFDGGLCTEIEAAGKSEAEQESGFQGPYARQMDRYYAELVLLEHAIVNKLDVDTADLRYATIERLEAVEASIQDLDVTKLTARVAVIEAAYIDRAQVNALLADYASIAQLDAVNAKVTNISGELSTYKTQVAGQLTAFEADITSLKVKDAEMENALIGTAKISDLEAIRTKTQELEADVADINTLVNGNLTSDNIHSMVITGEKFTVENGFIKSAMIDSLAADKITGLDINTTKMTVHSDDGRSTWADNTIQIADADRVRVQIGKDASGDYNIYIWDKSGNLMFDPLYGVQESGIKKPIIRNDMVSDTAKIAGHKLDIEDVIKEVNGAETVINSTRIKLDSQGQTLDVAFNSLKTYTEGVNSRTESNTTAISAAQGQIRTLISNTTVVKDGQTVQLKDAFNSTVADVSSIKTTINEHTSLIDQQSGKIKAVETKANTIESDLSGTRQTISAVQSDLSGTKSRVATVESSLDGLKTRVAATESGLSQKADGTTVDSLTSRVATAESSINGFQASLTATNKTVSDNYTALNSKIDGIEIGSRNLIINSSFENGQNGWSGFGSKTSVVQEGKDGKFCLKQVGALKDNIGLTQSRTLGEEANGVYTFSGWYKTDSLAFGTTNPYVGAYLAYYNDAGKWVNEILIYRIPAGTNGWTYAEATFKVPDNPDIDTMRFTLYARDFTGTIWWDDIKLEKGTKATDWTPAPEDTQSILDTHTEQISTHDTRITAAENGISLKVSSSDFNSYKTSVNNEIVSAKSRLSTAESSITALNGQIALKASKTDIDTLNAKFANYSTTTQMQSAISLAKDSITQSVSATYATKASVNTVSGNVATLTSRVQTAESKLTKDGLVTTIGSYYATQTYAQGIGETAANALNTANAKGTDYSQGKMLFNDPMFASGINSCGVYNNSSNGTVTISRTAKSSDNPMTGTNYELTVKTAGAASPGLGGFVQNIWSRANAVFIRRIIAKIPVGYKLNNMENPMGTGKTVIWLTPREGTGKFTEYVYKYICGPSGEFKNGGHVYLEGPAATSSSPVTWYVAYSTAFDMTNIADVVSAQSVATQTQEKMNWIVKSGTSATDFTLTDRTATLVANAINLKGLVTFAGLDSAAQGKITAAQGTADSAKAAAATAQSTANTAKTNAATAQSTADAAKTAAANAQSTANTANSTANAALTYITIQDTRDDNQTPQWYMTNHRQKIVREFKYCSKIGLSVSSTFCTLETKVQWHDATGGYPTQVATVGNDNKVYKRVGTSNTTWSPWVSADQVIADWCYSNNLTYINGGKIYTGTVTAAQIAANTITGAKIAAGTITADKINVSDLFSKNITATGTITGVTLKSAVINSTSGTIGGFTIGSTNLRNNTATLAGAANSVYLGNDGISCGTAFKVTKAGALTATTGTIGNLTVNSSGLSYGSLAFGTFSLTKNALTYGKFSVDKNGVTIGTGGFTDGSGVLRAKDGFSFNDYSGTMRTPVASTSTNGSRVAYMTSNLSNGIRVAGQWGVANASFSYKTFTASSSDIRLKTNVRPTEVEALPLLNRIGLYQFDWKRDGAHQKIGFIADYLEQQDSSLSIGGGYDKYGMMDEKVVNDFYLMGYVVKGIQELCTWTANYAADTGRAITAVKSGLEYARNTAANNQQRLTCLEAKTRADAQSVQAQLTSVQTQLQQALNRIAEQDKLIRQLQEAAG